MNPPRKRFALELTDCGRAEDGDAFLRLRAALKRLSRSYGLRCTSVREVKPDDGQDGVISEHEKNG